jgi:hypothetical protein
MIAQGYWWIAKSDGAGLQIVRVTGVESDEVAQIVEFLGGSFWSVRTVRSKGFEFFKAKVPEKAILNEKDAPPGTLVMTPPASHRGRIVSDRVNELRSHPDFRIARRALIIGRLTQVISECKAACSGRCSPRRSGCNGCPNGGTVRSAVTLPSKSRKKAMTTPDELRSRTMRAVKGKDTKFEWLIRRLLHRDGYRYRLHVKDLPGKPDLVFPARRKVIFVHGCWWHGHDWRVS